MAEEERSEQDVQAADEAAPDEGAADEDAAAADEAAAPDEAAEPAGTEAPAGEPEAPAGEPEAPEAPLTPRQRRKLARSRHAGQAAPQLGPAERAVRRAEDRRAKSASRRRYRARSRARTGEPGHGTPPAERRPGTQKVRQGTVVSARADKTITVRVEIARRHRTYEKVVRRTATLHAHDESNQAGEGDLVRVVETRPLSRTKRWRLVEVLEKAR